MSALRTTTSSPLQLQTQKAVISRLFAVAALWVQCVGAFAPRSTTTTTMVASPLCSKRSPPWGHQHHPLQSDHSTFQHSSRSKQQQPFLSRSSYSSSSTALGYGELRGVDAQLLFDTWEWTAGLGAPAALVAGAVLATMYESREEMSPRKSDSRWIRVAKKACRFLLLSAFGLEVVSIFVTTVTGTMLLAHGDAPVLANMNFNSPLGFLQANFEFECLTARIAFLLGLFHWQKREGVAARRMNQFTASSLLTILVGMVSFVNRHMSPYTNCLQMLRHYFCVCFYHYFWPPTPLAYVILPMTAASVVLGFRAFSSPNSLEKDDDDGDESKLDAAAAE